MKRQLQGIAVLLFGILMTLIDLGIYWREVFMFFGVVGLVIAFLPEKK